MVLHGCLSDGHCVLLNDAGLVAGRGGPGRKDSTGRTRCAAPQLQPPSIGALKDALPPHPSRRSTRPTMW